MFTFEKINAILHRHDPVRIAYIAPNEYELEARDLLNRFLSKEKRYRLKDVHKEVHAVFEHWFEGVTCTEGALQSIAHAIWEECFQRHKKMTPTQINSFERKQSEFRNRPKAEYPTIKTNPYIWSTSNPSELRRPLLWLVTESIYDGNQAWLVNVSGETLNSVAASKTGFGGGDAGAFGYNASEDWVYQHVPHNHCVLVDEWDMIVASDFFLFCELTIDLPSYGVLNFCAKGTKKGNIDSQVLLWDNTDKINSSWCKD